MPQLPSEKPEEAFAGALKEISQILKRGCVIYFEFKIDQEDGKRFWRITLSNASSKLVATTVDAPEPFEPPEIIKYNLWGDDISSAANRPRSRYICLNVMHTLATMMVLLGFEVRVNDEDFDPYEWPKAAKSDA